MLENTPDAVRCDTMIFYLRYTGNGDGVKIKIEINQVSQSTTHGTMFAGNAVNGTNSSTHTSIGIGQWWKAEFQF